MLLLNIYVTDLMQTCYIHVQQYQIITFAVYRGRLLLARDYAGILFIAKNHFKKSIIFSLRICFAIVREKRQHET